MKQTKIRAIGIYVEPTEKQMTGAFLRMASFSENESAVTLPSFSILMRMIPLAEFCEWLKSRKQQKNTRQLKKRLRHYSLR